jgi:hypothetical protein
VDDEAFSLVLDGAGVVGAPDEEVEALELAPMAPVD